MSAVDHSDQAPRGMTRRQMLRAGTLVGATAAWVAPSATVHALTASLAQATSGDSTPTTVRKDDETTDTTVQQTDNTTPEPNRQKTDTTPEDTTTTTSPGTTETTAGNTETTVAESTTETAAGSEATKTDEPTETVQVAAAETSTDTTTEVAVLGSEITAEAPVTAARPTSAPTVIAQTELPQTGMDADILGGIGAALTGLGAAALAATREPKSD